MKTKLALFLLLALPVLAQFGLRSPQFVGSLNVAASSGSSGASVDNTLVVHYKFNEGSGTNIADATSTYAATGISNTWATGASGSGSSIVFNGTTAWAKTDGNVTYGTNIVAFSFWIYEDNWTAGTTVFETTSDLNSGNAVVLFDASDKVWYRNSGGGYRSGAFTKPTGSAWHHVVIQCDASSAPPNFIVHINGSEVTVTEASIGSPGTTALQASILYIASRAGLERFNAFRLDDFRVYKGLLSEDEIDSLYANPE